MPSISSRTAYVILWAIEEDLRNLIQQHAGDRPAAVVLGESVAARAAERRMRDGRTPANEVSPLLPYIDFQDAFDVAMRIKSRLPDEVANGLSGLNSMIGKLALIRNRVAHNRPLEIDDLPVVVDFSMALIGIRGFDWESSIRVREEIKGNPAYVLDAEVVLIADPSGAIANNLPSPDFDETSLLGRREECRQVKRALLGAWPVITILGDGGIGKTALALQVCYDLVDGKECPFEAVVWASARNAELTSTEIVRIGTAVQDSLGLFASATAELGGTATRERVIDELLEMMASFPMLLVLDNVETVLDERIPEFLRDIPKGSKVLITSRIGVKTEQPIKLSGISLDDAVRLLRILAKRRGIELLGNATDSELRTWAEQMGGRPAYIKWFVAGVQSGQTPERLLSDNGLILDFCMSNVFDYLSEDARAVLRSMLAIPGSHTLAELAFLNDFDAARTRSTVLELTTTNFVVQVRGGASGTALELSDFSRAYLRRTLKVQSDERSWLSGRQRELYSIGGSLQAAHARAPYSAETIDVRGVGDYSAARRLRDAVELGPKGKYDEALQLCREAAELAPGYHEAARVEALVHERSMNYAEAYEAYARAKDLAPDDSHVAFFFGMFLINAGFDPQEGLIELQRAASLDPSSAAIQLGIIDAHLSRGDAREAMAAAAYALQHVTEGLSARSEAVFKLLSASAISAALAVREQNWAAVAEDTEFAVEAIEDMSPDVFSRESLDLCLLLSELASEGNRESADDFIADKNRELAARLTERRRRSDPSHLDRAIGSIENLVPTGGYGFIRSAGKQFFFHTSALWDRRAFDELERGSKLAFTPGEKITGKSTPALDIYWVA